MKKKKILKEILHTLQRIESKFGNNLPDVKVAYKQRQSSDFCSKILDSMNELIPKEPVQPIGHLAALNQIEVDYMTKAKEKDLERQKEASDFINSIGNYDSLFKGPKVESEKSV
jgi:hypothetical protein